MLPSRIRQSSLSVVPCGHPKPNFLEAVPSLDHCSQQSRTVDTFRPSFSAVSREEGSPSRSRITGPRLNLVSC
ncbi:uncharacterized protein TNCV_3885851 [Trichonephila clavipes]|nr:uncharacterized protein TNCV_3885851 [Trichonephila clavipes]